MVEIITINGTYNGQRLDNYLLRELKGVPKSHIYKLIRKGSIRVNKKRVKADYRLLKDDQLRLPPMRVSTSTLQPTYLSDSTKQQLLKAILFEDDYFLVINKPRNLAVHAGSGVNLGLIEQMRLLRADLDFIELCHRIDKATTGCVLLAKQRPALLSFQQSLRAHAIEKKYLLITHGKWPKETQLVDQPLQKGEIRSGEYIVSVDDQGKRALTRFNLKKYLKGASLVEAELVTGRTHQIRVHCAAIGHPIVGDDKYGNRNLDKALLGKNKNGLLLHAQSLSFTFVLTSKHYCFQAAPDQAFATMCK